ncbi:DUF5949 family protein [Streptomyces sp. NPDC048309]
MTSTPSETRSLRSAEPGTFVAPRWSGEAPDGTDMQYLPALGLRG